MTRIQLYLNAIFAGIIAAAIVLAIAGTVIASMIALSFAFDCLIWDFISHINR